MNSLYISSCVNSKKQFREKNCNSCAETIFYIICNKINFIMITFLSQVKWNSNVCFIQCFFEFLYFVLLCNVYRWIACIVYIPFVFALNLKNNHIKCAYEKRYVQSQKKFRGKNVIRALKAFLMLLRCHL